MARRRVTLADLAAALEEDPRARSSRVTRRTTKPRKRRVPLDEAHARSRKGGSPAGPEAAVLRRQVAREVEKVKRGSGPRVDSGDVLRRATPESRRQVRADAPTRRVGRTTVDTGDILSGQRVPAKRPQRPSFTEALTDELTREGAVAKALARLLVPAEKRTVTINGRRARVQGSGLGSLGVTDGGRKVIADAVNLPKNAVIGLYEVGASAKEAAGGDTRRAKRLIDGLDDGVLGQLLVHGDVKGAARAFNEHPLYGALEVTAAGQVAGRGAGAGARAGVAGGRAKRAAGQGRAPLRVEGTNQQLERDYSPNVIVKAAQVLAEKDQRARGLDPNVARGAKRRRLLNQEVDEFASQAEGMRRRGREEAARVGAKIAPVRSGDVRGGRGARTAAAVDRGRSRAAEATSLPGVRGRAERDVVMAAVEGRLRGPESYVADLKRERARLQRVYLEDRARPKDQRQLTAGARRANREQVRALDRALNDPKAMRNAAEVFRAADDYKRAADAIEGDLVKKRALDKEQADTARLRPYGVAVMGLRPARKARAPEHLEERHEQARRAEGSARERLAKARDVELRAKAKVDRLAGANRAMRAGDQAKGKRQRAYYVGDERFARRSEAEAKAKATGKRVRPVALTVREADRTGRAAQAQRRYERAMRERRASVVALRKAVADREASKPTRRVSGLEDADGRRVSTAEIRAHIETHGNREPAFVGQRRSDRGARSFFVNWQGGRKTVDSKRRTGEAARTGAYDASFGALEEHLVRGRGVADAIGSFDDFVGRFGSRRRDGKPYTYDEAVRAADELAEATGMRWLPVRAVPARYDEATREGILEAQGTAAVPQHLESLVQGRLDDSLKPPEGKERLARNVVLVPAQQVQRFAAHQTQGSGTGAKLGQVGTRMFRNTVLPFSMKWLFGNVAEAALRSALAGVTPGDYVRGRRMMNSLRALDDQVWKQADTRLRGGLLFGSADRLNVRRGPEDFEGTMFETPAKAVAFVARLPVVRQTIAGLNVYTRSVFAANRGIERAFQTAAIGKQARRDAQELTGSWWKAARMHEDVAREVARGLLGTPKQVQFGRSLDELLGKYGRFSPGTRRIIQSYAPFLPWFLNAARFSFYTLPARHPVKTALLANVTVALEDEIEAQRKSVPPGDLESAIRTKDGGLVNLARYTPFGLVTKGAAGVADPLLPQIDSAVAALKGQSFTGRPLQLENREDATEAKKLWLAIYTLAEGAVPGVQIIRRVREKGATPYDDSTVFSPKVKPGTASSGAADRILNPLRPTYLSGAAPDLSELSPALRRRVERVQRSAGAGSEREEILRRRAERIQRDAR